MEGTIKKLLALLVVSYSLQACELPVPAPEKPRQSKKQKLGKSSKKKHTKKKTRLEQASMPSFSGHLNESPISSNKYEDNREYDTKLEADLSEYATSSESGLSYMEQEMLNQINALRRKGCSCDGQYFPPVKPLTVNQKLVRAASNHASEMNRKKRLSHYGYNGHSIDGRLKREGYNYQEASQNITAISKSAKEALKFMMRNPKNCANIMRPDFKEVGVGNQENYWAQVFAKPKIPIGTFYKPQTVSYSKNKSFQREMLIAVNKLRATGCYCGNTYYPPVPSLKWNVKLERSSYNHSSDMARIGVLSHRGSDGSRLQDRVKRVGYDYRSTGENVSLRKHSIQAAVDSWRMSPGHCVNMMRREFTDMGAAEYNSYWTQNFGSRL